MKSNTKAIYENIAAIMKYLEKILAGMKEERNINQRIQPSKYGVAKKRSGNLHRKYIFNDES
jgi:hypothetical protein